MRNDDDDNKSCLDKMKYIGHIFSLILTLIVIITIIGSISGVIAAIIYLFECYINKTWKKINCLAS